MSANHRRCCEPGCEAVSDPEPVPHPNGGHGLPRPGWYKIDAGFMNWACPVHARSWRTYDARRRAEEAAHGAAFEEALRAFEREWEEAHPLPPTRAFQPSLG